MIEKTIYPNYKTFFISNTHSFDSKVKKARKEITFIPTFLRKIYNAKIEGLCSMRRYRIP